MERFRASEARRSLVPRLKHLMALEARVHRASSLFLLVVTAGRVDEVRTIHFFALDKLIIVPCFLIFVADEALVGAEDAVLADGEFGLDAEFGLVGLV